MKEPRMRRLASGINRIHAPPEQRIVKDILLCRVRISIVHFVILQVHDRNSKGV